MKSSKKLCGKNDFKMICISDHLGCFVHSRPRSLFFMQQVISLIIVKVKNTVIMTITKWPFLMVSMFSVEIKKGGSSLSNSSVIVAHDCINGSAYSRELVTLSWSLLS